jgi:hypothetical protein
MQHHHLTMPGRSQGNALAETLVALLALTPLLAGIPLLGKQLDIRHKSLDAARYSVWERTVWRSDGVSNRKPGEQITLEAHDRTVGDPRTGLIAGDRLYEEGVTENLLWRDHRGQRLLAYERAGAVSALHEERRTPGDVGRLFAPAIAHGDGVLAEIAGALQVDHLGLSRRAFANATVTITARPTLAERADRSIGLGQANRRERSSPLLAYAATAAVLSDSWSAADEGQLGGRVDDVTTNELIEMLELPARVIGMQAIGRGRPLYGEGQFAWDPDLRPRSTVVPSAYVRQR